MLKRATNKLHSVSLQGKEKEESKNGDEDAIVQGYIKGTAIQRSGWKLGEETQVQVVEKGNQDSCLCTECKLDGYKAIPIDPCLEPFTIPNLNERRCAFNGALVLVEEVGRTVEGKTGRIASVRQQGAVEPMICTVDPLSPCILVPVSDKNSNIVNQPELAEAEQADAATMVKCYSPEDLTRCVDAIPI